MRNKSRKEKSAFKTNLEYYAVKTVAAILYWLPLSIAVFVGQSLFLILHKLDKRHREQCANQIANALKVDREQSLRITRQMYKHLGTMLAEFPRVAYIKREEADKYIDWNGAGEMLEQIKASGKSMIYVTGHIGNWEATGTLFGAKNYNDAVIGRPLDNVKIDKMVKDSREKMGQEIWDKFGAMRMALRAIKNGKKFGILMDIDGGKDGLPSTFFGLKCSTLRTVADLAIKTGCPMMIIAGHRTAPMRFRFEHSEVFYADQNADKETERLRIIQKCNDELERIIRKAPEQWLWLHRRWKTQFDGEEKNNGK
jgi:KDO2-lipid IV(A) lauroyltransferase